MPDSYDAFVELTKKMPEAELAVLKSVFLSPEGEFVLGVILDRCKFMKPCENEQDMALNNFAKELLIHVYFDRERDQVKMYRIIELIKTTLKRRRRRHG